MASVSARVDGTCSGASNHGTATLATEKTQGIVIRMADFSESSRVVTFFTRDWGKVAVVAKGARRLKGPFEAALDLLTVCNIVFIRKSSAGLDILTEAQLQKRFKPRAGHLGSLYAGYYVAELLDGLSEEYDSHPLLFDESLLALDRLAGDAPVHLAVLRFELVVLREIGQLPAFDECVSCGALLTSDQVAATHAEAGPISAPRFTFRSSQGGLICSNCRGEEESSLTIAAGTVALLRLLAGASESAWQRVAASPSQIQEMRGVIAAAISQALGRRPKMLRYLQF